MATLEKTFQVVLEFAQNNPFTSSPASVDDQVVPAPAQMPFQTYQQFFEALRAAAARGGIVTNLPFQGVRDSVTWLDVANCVFFNQTGAR